MASKTAIQDLNGRDSYDGILIPTDFVFMKKNFKKEVIRFYLSELKEGQVLLDLNAGLDGFYKEPEVEKNEYIALDQNRNVRSFLEKSGVRALDWDVPYIPLNDNSVDYVLSTPFIEHLPTYLEAVELLIEIKRVLKEDGRLLIIVPNYTNLKAIFYEDYKHTWITTKKRVVDMLMDCGYGVTDTRYTIGWITLKMNPFTSVARFFIAIFLGILRNHFVERILETIKLDTIAAKFKKTLFELVVVEAKITK